MAKRARKQSFPRSTGSLRRSGSLRRRDNFVEAKLKTKNSRGLGFTKAKQPFVEAKACLCQGEGGIDQKTSFEFA